MKSRIIQHINRHRLSYMFLVGIILLTIVYFNFYLNTVVSDYTHSMMLVFYFAALISVIGIQLLILIKLKKIDTSSWSPSIKNIFTIALGVIVASGLMACSYLIDLFSTQIGILIDRIYSYLTSNVWQSNLYVLSFLPVDRVKESLSFSGIVMTILCSITIISLAIVTINEIYNTYITYKDGMAIKISNYQDSVLHQEFVSPLAKKRQLAFGHLYKVLP